MSVRRLVRLHLSLAVLMPVIFSGGSRPWRRGRAEDVRAAAQEAKDAAAAAFYEVDTAQRDLRIAVETIGAADTSPEAARAVADFDALAERVDRLSAAYIRTVDTHDLDAERLDGGAAQRAFSGVKSDLERARGELARFADRVAPLQERAASQLAQVGPAVERAKEALRTATAALDAARAGGLRTDEQAAALAALGPDLRLLGEGAGRHGVQATIRRADAVRRRAGALAAEVERLPEQAAEIDRRLSSLRTRADAVEHHVARVEPVLSELRRRFSAPCWRDLQTVPSRAAESVAAARDRLREAAGARAEQRFRAATTGLAAVHGLLDGAQDGLDAAEDRLERLNEVAADARPEIDRTRFAVRDAQRLAMTGRTVPDPRHAGPLDAAAARLGRAVAALEHGGRHPDYWSFLTETEAVRTAVASVVRDIRAGR
ncbi:hypothetical protein [Streptomyces sp. RFCAC02]|uniref:hypothetical protein n=1 Tax=Streptomyces sp. RFCAC02 TaxID=2499143 RepID=UPI001021CB15|nr:hypothetical protein [Streptomyces sp. RFCAC02]